MDTERWEKLVEFPFLDAASSGCSGLLRSFYVPILSAQKCAYSDYQVRSILWAGFSNLSITIKRQKKAIASFRPTRF